MSADSRSPDTSVRVRNLRVDYGRRVALHDLSLEVPAGEIFGLLGPNGADQANPGFGWHKHRGRGRRNVGMTDAMGSAGDEHQGWQDDRDKNHHGQSP